MKFKYLTGAD